MKIAYDILTFIGLADMISSGVRVEPVPVKVYSLYKFRL